MPEPDTKSRIVKCGMDVLGVRSRRMVSTAFAMAAIFAGCRILSSEMQDSSRIYMASGCEADDYDPTTDEVSTLAQFPIDKPSDVYPRHKN